jgi:hypothetical protein
VGKHQEIIRLLEAGRGVADVAAEVDCSVGTVYKALKGLKSERLEAS